MRIATWFMLAVVVGVFGVDAYFLATGGFKATISYMLWTNFHEYPVLSFLLGMVVGHLVWPLNDYKTPVDGGTNEGEKGGGAVPKNGTSEPQTRDDGNGPI